MARFSPTVLPGQGVRRPEDDFIRGFERGSAAGQEEAQRRRLERRQAALDELAAERDARDAEAHETKLFDLGYRRGPVPEITEPIEGQGTMEFGGVGLQRGQAPDDPDPFVSGLSGLRRRGPAARQLRDPAGPLAEPEPPPFTPGQFVPGLGFQAAPMTSRPDPRMERVSDDLYRDPSATPEGRLQRLLLDRGLPVADANLGANRPDLIDNLLPEPEEPGVFTVEDLLNAGLTPEDAQLGARDPVYARQALERIREPDTPDDVNWQTVQDDEGNFHQVNPRSGDTRPVGLRGRTPAGRQTTPTERRTQILGDARAMFRALILQRKDGSSLKPDDPSLVRMVAQSMAIKYGTSEQETFGIASQAAQDAKVERETPIGSPTNTGSAAGRTAPDFIVESVFKRMKGDTAAVRAELVRMGYKGYQPEQQ